VNSRRPLLLVLAAGALVAGCGPDKQLNLDLRPVSITVPRLVTPAVTIVPAAPPVTAPLPPIDFSLPPLAVPSAAPTTPTAPPPVVACPKAGAFDVPAVPASVRVLAAPAPGSYTQTVAGTYATATATGALSGGVTQVVTALPRQTSIIGQVIDSWSVTRTGPDAASSSVEVYRLVHESALPAGTAAGIYLVALAWKDPVRGDLTFTPMGDGLFLLPSPVSLSASSGTQYTGSATDPNTLTTLSIVRNVTGKKRIDACGSLIDTYTVEMTGVLTTSSTQRQVAWTQQLATSYGGLPVQDSLTLTEPAGGFSWKALRTSTALPKAVSP
jgi:hypothetical protein